MEEEVVKAKSPLNDGLKGVDLVTMNVVTKDVELVSKEDLIKAFPDKSKTITDELVQYINMAQTDPQFDVLTMFNQMIEYRSIIDNNSKNSMFDYVNAIKFCSYLEACNDNYTQAYIKTFSFRDAVKKRMFADTSSSEYKELTSMASQYSRLTMVQQIRTLSDAPLQLLMRGSRMKALSMLMTEAATCASGRDRIAALDAFLKHTTAIADKSTKLEVNVGVAQDSQKRFDSMIEQLRDVGRQQREMLALGMDIGEVQKLNLRKEEIIDVDEDDAC